MARTAIAITRARRYVEGENPTETAGDAANDHQLDLSSVPIVLIAVNSNAADVAFSIELPASDATYNAAVSKAHTVPGADTGVDGVRTVWIESTEGIVQSGSVLHIDSADANFDDVRFYALRRP